MKKHLSILFFACAISVLLQSCYFQVNTFGRWKNQNIDKEVRNEIGLLDKKLFKSIMTKNVSGVKQLMSKTLIDISGKKIDTLVNGLGDAFKANDYKLLDEFYTKNTNENTSTTLQSDKGDYNDYKIEYLAINKETYVSVMVSTDLPVNCMVLAIYGKYDNGWKLNILQMGEYSIMDQTAPEYYTSALNQYGKGNVVDAVDMIVMASKIAYPVGKYFSYLNDYEMKDTYSVILKDANTQYHFPLIVGHIKTKPQIFAINPQFVSNAEPKGILPIIQYNSSIPIKDTTALKIENQGIQKVIGDMFIGIDKNKPGIIYQVFNHQPDGKTNTTYYTFVQKLKYGK
jgi:hypothetical protein